VKPAVIILALLSAVLYALLFVPGSDDPDVIRFLVISQLIFAVYLGLLYLCRRLGVNPVNNRRLWLMLIGIALLIRVVTYVGSDEQAWLSDDVYRYVWEGKLVLNGYNPYITSPRDMAGTMLADSTIYPHINHNWLPTIYPPLSEYLFVVAYSIGGDSLHGFKLLSFLFELATAMLLLYLVIVARLPWWTYFIYLFSPLIIIEFIMSSHLDILAMPFFVLSLALLTKRPPPSAIIGVLLACTVAIKLYALFFVPIVYLFFRNGGRTRFLVAFLLTLVLLYLPFVATAGWQVFGSLWTSLGTWQYNGSIFKLFDLTVGNAVARIISGALFVTVFLGAIFYKRRRRDLFERMFLIFGAYLILTPSLFGWYLVWIVPFLVIFRNLSFLVLTGTVFLSYHVLIGYYRDGVWSEYWLLRVIEYLPFFVLLGMELYRRISRREPLST